MPTGKQIAQTTLEAYKCDGGATMSWIIWAAIAIVALEVMIPLSSLAIPLLRDKIHGRRPGNDTSE